MSTQQSKKTFSNKFQAELKVDPTLMCALIGLNGCNIKRITTNVRNGCYIRGNGDSFTISAYTNEAVIQAKNMIVADESALKDSSKKPSKPSAIFKVDDSLVPHIIGKHGIGLKNIMETVGLGCYIYHKDSEFKIAANNVRDITIAINILKAEALKYSNIAIQGQLEKIVVVDETKAVRAEPVKTVAVATNNKFSLLLDEYDSDEEPTTPVKAIAAKTSGAPMKAKKLFTEPENITLSVINVPKLNTSIWGNKDKVSQIVESVKLNGTFVESDRLRLAKQNAKLHLEEQFKRLEEAEYLNYINNLDNEEYALETPDYPQPVFENISLTPVVEKVDLKTYIRKIESSSISWADMCDDDEYN